MAAIRFSLRGPVDTITVDVAVADQVFNIALHRLLRLADEIDLHQRLNAKSLTELQEGVQVIHLSWMTIWIPADVILPIEI